MNAYTARVSGEAFDADQIEWRCEDCGCGEYSCDCEDEPTCEVCGDVLIGELCADCDCDELELAPFTRISPTSVPA